jgi:hypothetical protein
MSESFHVNLSYPCSVVLDAKKFNDLTNFLYFCDYLPFEDDLALYLYNLESPLPKDNLYQVWLKLTSWFWRFFFNINTYKYVFCYCGSSRPLGTMVWTNLNLHYVKKISNSGSVVFEKTIFKWLHTIFVFLWLSPLWKLAYPLPKDDLYQVWLKLAFWFWRRFFLKINICKYGFPYYDPSRRPGAMMWTILSVHYIRKLSCKYEVFWLNGSGKEDF